MLMKPPPWMCIMMDFGAFSSVLNSFVTEPMKPFMIDSLFFPYYFISLVLRACNLLL